MKITEVGQSRIAVAERVILSRMMTWRRKGAGGEEGALMRKRADDVPPAGQDEGERHAEGHHPRRHHHRYHHRHFRPLMWTWPEGEEDEADASMLPGEWPAPGN